jgi:hypothetical protein
MFIDFANNNIDINFKLGEHCRLKKIIKAILKKV